MAVTCKSKHRMVKNEMEQAFQESTMWHRNSQFAGMNRSEELVEVINISLPRLRELSFRKQHGHVLAGAEESYADYRASE